MTSDEFELLNERKKKALLRQCCGAKTWVEKIVNRRLPKNLNMLLQTAEKVWYECGEEDWKEAFLHHPKIGDKEALRRRFFADKFAAVEQSAVGEASEKILDELAEGNEEYEKKFGYIFVVCATGKPADEMLAILRSRLSNTAEEEIKIAMEEQNKITKLRLQKLFEK